MNLNDIEVEALKIDVENSDEILEDSDFIVTTKLYKMIMRDLTEQNFKTVCSYKKEDVRRHDATVFAYPPKLFTKTQHSAIKLCFRNYDLKCKMKQCDSYLYCGESVDVCEFWKNGDNFSIFATASRADVLNNFTVSEIKKFIEEMVLDIFKIKISVENVYKKYWKYGYHFPSMKDKTKYKKGKYSCGEWLSPEFDATISSAIDSAEKTFRDLERDGYLK
jgi:hypothetical protein